MNHLTEEQLIEHYYGESPQSARIDHHLRECIACSEAYAAVRGDLAAFEPITVPARGALYGEQVWQSIRNLVPVYERKQQGLRHRFNNSKSLGFATAWVALIAVAIFAGRQWENHRGQLQVQTAATRPPTMLAVLGDHLGRSERLLVALKHDSGDSTAPVKAEAQNLLADNRLYRESATNSGNPAFAAALEQLERVLVEIANEPDDASPARLAELQKELNTDGLLFEVRVLRSRVRDDQEEEQTGAIRTKGALI